MSNATQTHHAADERRYTPQELALLWKCCIETVYDLLRQGKLAGFKLGRDWRITESAVRAYEQDPANQAAKTYAPRNKGAPAKPEAHAPQPKTARYRVV